MEYNVNNTEFALLLLIGEMKGCNGYTMRSLVEERGYAAWSGVSASSIYVTLKKLEKRNLVNSRPDVEKSSKGPTGRLFELKAAGKKAMTEALVDSLSSCREHDPRFNLALCGIDFLSTSQLNKALEKRATFLAQTFSTLSDRANSGEMPLSAQLLYGRILAGIDAELKWTNEAIRVCLDRG